MRAQAYGTWDAMLNESVVRAFVVRYYLAHGQSARARSIVDDEIRSGFLWTGDLVDLLAEYEQNRRTYESFNAFMPRVIEFFNRWSTRG